MVSITILTLMRCRPETRWVLGFLSSRSSWSSLTELAVGLTEWSGLRCWALAKGAAAKIVNSNKAPSTQRMLTTGIAMGIISSST